MEPSDQTEVTNKPVTQAPCERLRRCAWCWQEIAAGQGCNGLNGLKYHDACMMIASEVVR
jgi:hypothetical protein